MNGFLLCGIYTCKKCMPIRIIIRLHRIKFLMIDLYGVIIAVKIV